MKKTKKLRKLMKAAIMGKPYAQYQLGIWYQLWHKEDAGLNMAAAWIRLAAESKYAPAQEWLKDYTFDDSANTQASV